MAGSRVKMTTGRLAGPRKPPQARRGRPGRPTDAAAAELAHRIAAAAADLFLALGYRDTTMALLARQAGVSKKTIYARYADKEALFRAVVGQFARPSIRERILAEDGLPLLGGLRRRAMAILGATLEPRSIAFYRLVLREVGAFPEIGRTLDRHNREELYRPLEQYFAARRAAGELGAAEPRWAARLFVYLLFGDMNHRLLMAAAPPTKAELAAYVGRICSLFAAGIRLGR